MQPASIYLLLFVCFSVSILITEQLYEQKEKDRVRYNELWVSSKNPFMKKHRKNTAQYSMQGPWYDSVEYLQDIAADDDRLTLNYTIKWRKFGWVKGSMVNAGSGSVPFCAPLTYSQDSSILTFVRYVVGAASGCPVSQGRHSVAHVQFPMYNVSFLYNENIVDKEVHIFVYLFDNEGTYELEGTFIVDIIL